MNASLLYGEDHNATSYSTETLNDQFVLLFVFSEDHNATSYSTENPDSKNITIQDIAAIPP